MNRRDFVRRGALWTLGATLLTPELVDRLTWKRRLWPGADFRGVDTRFYALLLKTDGTEVRIPMRGDGHGRFTAYMAEGYHLKRVEFWGDPLCSGRDIRLHRNDWSTLNAGDTVNLQIGPFTL